MSFPRHREIYRSDGRGWRREWARNGVVAAPGAHRFDESPAGYSLAGWSPPEPASASPAQSSMHQNGAKRYTFTVNGSLSPITLSHARGSLHSTRIETVPVSVPVSGDFERGDAAGELLPGSVRQGDLNRVHGRENFGTGRAWIGG